jgi:FAD/FMN-containing dehydrogenase
MNVISRDAISTSVETLREQLTGEYVTPEDARWDEARLAWNLAVDQRPAAVALPETVEDIAEVVRYARANGLRVAGQATGHNAAPLANGLEHTVLIKTHRMRAVQIDAAARVARVEPGTLWMDVTYPAGEHGLAPLAGSSPDVGVTGYVLGGGISWLGRKYGLAANNVVAIELVNADGDVIRASSVENADLFWALRGGGGSFGIVTAIEIRLYPVKELYAGWLIFPMERADEVLNAWREWVDTVSDEVTSGRPAAADPAAPGRARAAARATSGGGGGRDDHERGRGVEASGAAAQARPGDGHLRNQAGDRAAGAPYGSAAPGPGHGRSHAAA